MHSFSVYCGIRDRDVYVTFAEEPSEQTRAELQNMAITCSKFCYGPVCTTEFCPFFGKDSVRKGRRPARPVTA